MMKFMFEIAEIPLVHPEERGSMPKPSLLGYPGPVIIPSALVVLYCPHCKQGFQQEAVPIGGKTFIETLQAGAAPVIRVGQKLPNSTRTRETHLRLCPDDHKVELAGLDSTDPVPMLCPLGKSKFTREEKRKLVEHVKPSKEAVRKKRPEKV